MRHGTVIAPRLDTGREAHGAARQVQQIALHVAGDDRLVHLVPLVQGAEHVVARCRIPSIDAERIDRNATGRRVANGRAGAQQSRAGRLVVGRVDHDIERAREVRVDRLTQQILMPVVVGDLVVRVPSPVVVEVALGADD